MFMIILYTGSSNLLSINFYKDSIQRIEKDILQITYLTNYPRTYKLFHLSVSLSSRDVLLAKFHINFS